MSNLIVRAEKEIFLATNYWVNSVATTYITNAMKELSRRAGERGTKIVMKLIYDRGSPRQFFEQHYFVPEKEYLGQSVNLPKPEEIPHIDLQVMNYHKPLLGTFHCKYMIVDRKYAVLQSNNLQDNDNVEMMTHLEGPVIDSIYDMALISWHKTLDPPLPAAHGGVGSYREYDIGDVTHPVSRHELDQSPKGEASSEVESSQQMVRESNKIEGGGVAWKDTSEDTCSGPPTKKLDPKIDEFLHAGGQALQIQKPSLVGNPLPEHTSEDPHYDGETTSEVARIQTALSPKAGETRVEAVTRLLNHTTNQGFKGTAPESASEEEMTPYILHPISKPFPIAMVCREPYGPPNCNSVYNPQNEVWLSALRNATKNVFIQSPTLNSEPLIPAIIDACERGIDVYCYISLGYNDSVRFFFSFTKPLCLF
jgi:phosphatidylserine/phosphatidylglycerophosphate/cardiolipin synthase-like enzyme